MSVISPNLKIIISNPADEKGQWKWEIHARKFRDDFYATGAEGYSANWKECSSSAFDSAIELTAAEDAARQLAKRAMS